MTKRIIVPELLDHATDEEAAANLADLVRINRWIGGHRILLRHLRRFATPADRFTFLDVGAASGDMARVVQREFPRAVVISLDVVARNLRAGTGLKLVGDAFALPVKRVDFVHASLFLHHFTDAQVVELLRGMRGCAERAVIVQDLVRHGVARSFLPATQWLFGWQKLTVHDGAISVAAGFRRRELAALAAEAGMGEAQVESHGLTFRLSLVAGPAILKANSLGA